MADINNDGVAEIIVGCGDGRVYVFGDIDSLRRHKATNLLRNAMREYDAGGLSSAKADAIQAKNIYNLIGVKEGVSDTSRLLKDIDVIKSFNSAKEAYEAGDYPLARDLSRKTAIYYSVRGNSLLLLKVRGLSNLIEADYNLQKASELYSLKDYNMSSMHARQAKNYYTLLGDKSNANISNNILILSDSAINAANHYSKGLVALEHGLFDDSMEYFMISRNNYSVINDSKHVVLLSDLIVYANASSILQKSIMAFDSGRFWQSQLFAEKAYAFFADIDKYAESEMALSMISKASVAMGADEELRKAHSNYMIRKYDLAFKHASESMRLFMFTGYPSGYDNSSKVYLDTLQYVKDT